ncbi:hypothetical protein WJX77_000735 [Trebouxia sp. C0004]
MYFAYGWPKALAVGDAGFKQDVVSLSLDSDFCLIVFTGSAQIWAGGQHRIRLGHLERCEESLKVEGLNKRAYWCSSRRLLAVLTYNNYLHIYGMHSCKESVLEGTGIAGMQGLKHVDIFLQHSIAVQSAAAATCLVGDSRSILLGLSDGTCQVFSWQSKFRGQYNPFGSLTELQLRLQRSMSLRSQRSSLQPIAINSQNSLNHSRHLTGSGGLQASSSPSAASLSARQIGRATSTDRLSRSSSTSTVPDSICIESLDYSPSLKMLGVVLTDGRCAICRTADSGLAPAEQLEFSHWICGVGSGATCLGIAPDAQLIAVGLTNGEVALYKLHGHKGGRFSIDGSQAEGPVRVVSLVDWGYGPEAIGSVADLKWSPDNRAFAVGWRRGGLAVWSASGCRLMCSLRQTARPNTFTPLSSASSSAFATDSHKQNALPMESGIASLAWGPAGYQIMLAELGSTGQVLEVGLAKSLQASHRVAANRQPSPSYPNPEVHLLQADDRLLVVSEAAGGSPSSLFGPETADPQQQAGPRLGVQHICIPQQYIAARYPLTHASISPDGMDIAVAGTRGLGLYSRRSSRWRLFGDVSQEREIMVQRLLWLPRVVLVCAYVGASTSSHGPKPANLPCHLLLYPRYHLDHSSLLARYPLPQAPIALDALGSYVLVAFAPLELTLLQVVMTGALSPTGTPTAKIHAVRELSIMSVGQPITDIAIVEPGPGSESEAGQDAEGSTAADLEPRHCVLLRAGGQMSVLDMAQGSEMLLADDIESFWLSGPSHSSADVTAAPSQLDRAHSHSSSALSRTASLAQSSGRHAGHSEGEGQGRGVGLRSASTSSLQHVHDEGMNGSSGFAHHPAHVRTTSVADSADEAAQASGHGDVEVPWWTYGARGMQLWFPSSLAEPLSPTTRNSMTAHSTDPELEFDREVYPIGISIAEVAIIGITQRMTRSAASSQSLTHAHASYPCFHPLPESQPVLPCLLRRLLQKGKAKEALSLATSHSQAPHFARSLEWLLFTSLDINNEQMSRPQSSYSGGSYSQHLGMLEQWIDNSGRPQPEPTSANGRPRKGAKTAGPLLQAAAQLIRHFPLFRDIVVSVARKTDAQMWPALFAAVGSPRALLEALLDVGALQSAACCLLIVDRIQGAQEAHGLALRLIQASLEAGQYDLASELLRFLIPPGDNDILAAMPSHAPLHDHSNGKHPQSAANQDAGVGGWLASWLWSTPAMTEQVGGSSARPSAKQNAVSEHQASATGTAAWDLIAAHALDQLETASLREVAALGRSLAAVGGRLDSLLVAATSQGLSDQAVTPEIVLTGLAAASEQLPVVGDSKAQTDAQMLLDACQAAQLDAWVLPLALLQEDINCLAGIKQRHHQLWLEVKMELHKDEQLCVYLDVMASADEVRVPGKNAAS